MIYWQLFITFFFIGLFSFGGGSGMMALIEQEVVTRYGWMTSVELYRFIGISESTPGPIAVNIATSVGFYQGGFLGAFLATTGVVLPSFIILTIIAAFFKKFADNIYVKTVLEGVKPVILGLMVTMLFKIIFINIFGSFGYNNPINFMIRPLLITLIIFGIYFLYAKIFKKKMAPILLIVLSALIGIVIYL